MEKILPEPTQQKREASIVALYCIHLGTDTLVPRGIWIKYIQINNSTHFPKNKGIKNKIKNTPL